jgi:hypothetical protein
LTNAAAKWINGSAAAKLHGDTDDLWNQTFWGEFDAYKLGGGVYRLQSEDQVWATKAEDLDTLFFDEAEILAGPLSKRLPAPRTSTQTTPFLHREGLMDGEYVSQVDDSFPVYVEDGVPAFEEFSTAHHVREYRHFIRRVPHHTVTPEQSAHLDRLIAL